MNTVKNCGSVISQTRFA